LEGQFLPGPILQEIIITTSFEGLGLSAELLRAVAEQGYTVPTPIQAQAIPVVLSGRDLLGAAQTGTGKTAGFTLPLLQKLAAGANASTSPARHPIRALILVPTRELAAQVQESVRAYGRHLKLRSTVIFGGVGFNPQADQLRRGVDIVVATPGRLLDHVEQRTIDLRHVEVLVLDEADRMLDMGFIPAIRRVLALLPAKRQNLLFSATFPDEIRKLTRSFMRDPATIEVAPRNQPIELISQVAYTVHKDRKRELLAQLVKTHDWRQVLVFTRTKHGANRLAQQLERDGIESDAIHGNKSQGARTRALKRFKDNELRVLVATDIAARGLDIEELPHVVNYDLPHVAEDYVHRIGRTGRAGASGQAVSLVCAEDRPLLAAVERLTGKRIEQQIAAGFEAGSPHHGSASSQEQRQLRREDRVRQHSSQPRSANNSGRHRHGQQAHRHQPNTSTQSQRHGQPQGQGHGSRGPQPQRQHERYSAQPAPQAHRVASQPARLPEDEERQPTPERARNQLFPALFGTFGRKRG
jgi:ATP-dependent RNA helicase RhlE